MKLESRLPTPTHFFIDSRPLAQERKMSFDFGKQMSERINLLKDKVLTKTLKTSFLRRLKTYRNRI